MSKNTLSKTILAVAISTASAASFAVVGDLNKDVTGGTELQYSSVDFGNVTLTGNAERFPNQDGVGFGGVNISGNLTNNANISAQGDFADALELNFSDDGMFIPSSIGGSLINNGNLTVKGPAASAIVADNGWIGGSLVNNGNISVTGQHSDTIDDAPAGILLMNTRVLGDLTNTGNITVTGENASGISSFTFDGTTGDGRSKVGGNVNNKGNISASGTNVAGISLDNIDFGNDVINHAGATITASGTNASGIIVDDLSFNAIKNAGTINVSGTDAVGIRIRDSLAPQLNHGENGIINTGTIVSSGTAIKVESLTNDPDGDDNLSNVFVIRQNGGLIQGADKAIDGNFQTELHWTAGTITGDMANMGVVKMFGNGTFNGQEIEALLVDVQTGTLYMAKQTSTIKGGLNVASGGTLQVRISDLTNVATPILNVSSDATFANGSKVGVTATPGDFTGTRDGKTYTLVKAGSITDGGLTVVSNSALLNITNFTVDGTTIKATVTGKAGSTVADELAQMGGSNNAVNAVRPFADSVIGNLSEDDQVFQAFANADEAELARLAEQLSPEVNGGATQAALGGQSLISSALNARSAETRGMSSGDVLQETGVWVKALYSDADQGTRDGIAGYNAYSHGIIIGADGKLTPDLTLGVAYSYLTTDVNSLNSETQVDGQALTAYANWENGPIFVDASLTYGKNDNESKREVAGTTAEGDYDSDLFGVNVLAGYGFNLNNGLLVEPRAALRYSNVDIDGFTEKNSSAALTVGAQRMEVGEAGAGVRVAKDFVIGSGTLTPEVVAMGYHDFIGDKANTTSTFVLGGTPFVTNGATAARDSYEVGLGVDYVIGAVTVGASYNYLHKTDFNADTFSIKGRYDF